MFRSPREEEEIRNRQIRHVTDSLLQIFLLDESKKSNQQLATEINQKLKNIIMNKRSSFNYLINELNALVTNKDYQSETQLLTEISKITNQCDELNKFCQQYKATPLHYLVTNPDFFKLASSLEFLPNEINAVDNSGLTPLMNAIMANQLGWIQFLLKNGADVNMKAKNGFNAFLIAKRTGNTKVMELLQNSGASTNDIDKAFLTKRRLHYVFGGEKFVNDAQTKLDRASVDGGSLVESLETLTLLLQRFIKMKSSTDFASDIPKDLSDVSSNIGRIIANGRLTAQEQSNKVKNEKSLLGLSGCAGHLFGFSLSIDANGEITLSVAERGLLAKTNLKTPDNKVPSIWQIKVPEEHLLWVLEQLQEARKLGKPAVSDLLFKDFPNKLGNEWTYSQNQRLLKVAICFFGNLKTLLLNEFQKAFSDKDLAYKNYKEFTLFMRKELLREYKQYAKSDDPFVILAEKIIAEKETKFKTRFGP